MPENIENTSVDETHSKHYYRKVVWENLEKNDMVNHPRPCFHRIPNFKGADEASQKLSQLEEFRNAPNIKVNPDKPQEHVRFTVLDNAKNLYVPIPRLASGLLKHIKLDGGASKDDMRKAVSRKGIDENGKDIGISDDININLVVLGCVAVSREGYRIGKGKGFADLEFGILSQMKAVNQDTIVVTTVHDTQVFDKLPPDLFQSYDVPVDIIVTPTQVIHVKDRLKKPTGVIWNILSQRRVNMMPVLKTLRELDEKEGKDVTLKEVDSDVESRDGRVKKYRRYFKYNRRRIQSDREGKTSESQNEETKEPTKRSTQRRRYQRRPKAPKPEGEEKNSVSEGEKKKPDRPRSKNNLRKKQIDFTLMVRNIERTMRVRDMKKALAERGVKPRLITWRGFKGYCCLHFSKTKVATEADHNVDIVIGMLQNLKVNPEADTQLSVEVMRPISRIETTDVTAV